MAFDPSKFGAIPLNSSPSVNNGARGNTFNPADFGAVPIKTKSKFNQLLDKNQKSLPQPLRAISSITTTPILKATGNFVTDIARKVPKIIGEASTKYGEIANDPRFDTVNGASPLSRPVAQFNTALGGAGQAVFQPLVSGVGQILGQKNREAFNRGLPIVTGKVVQGVNAITPKPIKRFAEARPADTQAITGTIGSGLILAGGPKAMTGVDDVVALAKTTPGLVRKGGTALRSAKTALDEASLAAGRVPRKLEMPSFGLPTNEASLQSNILSKYEKGIKPTISGKGTFVKDKAYKDNIILAVKTIGENKGNLNFVDDIGDVVKGESPKNIKQFSEAINQTKKSVFEKYNNLAKQSGRAGVVVETSPIVRELDTVVNNKSIALTNPEAIKYAKAVQQRYSKIGSLDAEIAQDVIQNYNSSLDAFYRNPSYDSASKAAIDAMVANNVRKSLDKGITGLTGEQYSQLKKQYGSLSAIENDVTKSALREARKNTKGLIDFTDIFSGGQVINGILSLNPAQVVSGLGQKAISTYYKYINNPNRAIEQLFKNVDSLKNYSIPDKNFQTATAITDKPKPINIGISTKPTPKLPVVKNNDVDKLLQEARKYKSAEEFVKAQQPTHFTTKSQLTDIYNKAHGIKGLPKKK